MQKIRVKPEEKGIRLAAFLSAHVALSGRKAKQLLDARRVFVNGKRIWMAKHPLAPGDTVSIAPGRDHPEEATHPAVSVLHEDADLLIVNKPAGRVSNRSPQSVEALLQKQLTKPELRAAHRLDRDTSGCLIIALHPACFDAVVDRFKERQISKTYLALVAGAVPFHRITLTYAVDGREAVSRVTVLKSGREASLLEVIPETGRKHQIRRHLSRIGHPVLGDKTYQLARQSKAHQAISRQLLHAYRLKFSHPLTGQPVNCTAPLPEDFLYWKKKYGQNQ